MKEFFVGCGRLSGMGGQLGRPLGSMLVNLLSGTARAVRPRCLFPVALQARCEAVDLTTALALRCQRPTFLAERREPSGLAA
ncbi:hypothetical protein FF011L_16360 [Roseimaritima multifibrata]|uniref:Uncharacterized protein n=1 Tax=Roseimaritima multifibrata TaxID=1930274 RepID=A0A517MDC6_9BACT|nr:hypothetical protein FF011L_16360 [Roseimaritima multifibrata]